MTGQTGKEKSARSDAERIERLKQKYDAAAIDNGMRLRPDDFLDEVEWRDRIDQHYTRSWLEFTYGGLFTRKGLDERTRLLVSIAQFLAHGRAGGIRAPDSERACSRRHAARSPRDHPPVDGLHRLYQGGPRRAHLREGAGAARPSRRNHADPAPAGRTHAGALARRGARRDGPPRNRRKRRRGASACSKNTAGKASAPASARRTIRATRASTTTTASIRTTSSCGSTSSTASCTRAASSTIARVS